MGKLPRGGVPEGLRGSGRGPVGRAVPGRGGLGGSLGARGGRWGRKFGFGLLVEVKLLGGVG